MVLLHGFIKKIMKTPKPNWIWQSAEEINLGRCSMKRKHLGSKFEDFLTEDGILEGCRAAAIKFKIARELEKAMSERKISKAEVAKQLKTSRTGVDRLLDPENTSITLNTMAKVATLLGKRIEFALR